MENRTLGDSHFIGVPILAKSTLVSTSVFSADCQTGLAAFFPFLAQMPHPGDRPPDATAPEADCMSLVSKQLSSSGLSEEALGIITSGWKPATQRNYTSAIRQWLQFCHTSRHNSGSPTVPALIEFLLSLHKAGRSYSTINTARSAISVVYNVAGEDRLGEHPLVRRFMLGVRKTRPITPKYPTFWKLETLLAYLRTAPTNTLKELTLKLATILACLSVQRVHTLTAIDCSPKFEETGTYLFVFKDLKVARQRPHFIITLPSITADDPLHSAQLLQSYLDRTSAIRDAADRQLLISFCQPHRPVSTDTVSRWVRQTMSDAGIDTRSFGTHSVRGASASAAAAAGVPLDAILQAGDWSNTSSAFQRHYHRRPSLLPSCQVANTLLRSLS